MTARSADDIVGLEYDWLASDAMGHVALFSTAGGDAPEAFLQDTDAHEAAIHAVLATATCTKARFVPQLSSGLHNTWLMVAERGLYAFDSDANGGPYRLVAAPEHPIHVASLPDVAAAVARRLVYPRLRFGELQEISDDMLESGR